MKLLVVAGDHSGDIHSAALCHALHHHSEKNNMHIAALGGDALRKEADVFLGDLVHLGGFGFIKPVLLYWKLRRILKNTIQKYLAEEKPDGVILVDYYGFNIHIAALCAALSIPVLYFISPQVWASRSYRLQRLKKYIARMFVIFPFEVPLYKKAGIPVTFVGHPLMDRMPDVPDLSEKRQRSNEWHIGLLPGSRASEIIRHLPILINTAKKISAVNPKAKYSLFIPEHISSEWLSRMGSWEDLSMQIVKEDDFTLRKKLTFALTSSGTATLENALLGIPMAVVYKTSWATYFCARLMVRIPYICIVNILLNRYVVPEFIQHKASPDRIAKKTIELLSDYGAYSETCDLFQRLKQMLGEGNVVQRTAHLIVQELA